MDAHPTPNPPINVEQWMDFVIASAAHRSENADHRKFGDLLIQRYFVSLPERYKDDAVATRYLDEMLCAVAASVRGFSVVRDTFQTNWDSIKAAREAAKEQVERLESFSLLKKNGIWGLALAVVVGSGISIPLMQALKNVWGTSTLATLATVAGCIGGSVILVEIVIEWIRGRISRRVQLDFPADVLSYWEERSLKGYRMVLRQFLPLAVEISNRHYPDSCAETLTDEECERIVERHFAFKSKKVEPAPVT